MSLSTDSGFIASSAGRWRPFNGVAPAMGDGLSGVLIAHARSTRKSAALPVISSAIQISDDGNDATSSRLATR
jgi:hypothetical protein